MRMRYTAPLPQGVRDFCFGGATGGRSARESRLLSVRNRSLGSLGSADSATTGQATNPSMDVCAKSLALGSGLHIPW